MDAETRPESPALRAAVGGAAFVIVVAGMRQAASVVAPALIAVLLAVAVMPLQSALRKYVGKIGAYLATLAVVMAIILGLVALIGVAVAGFAEALPRYAGRTDDVSRQANTLLLPSGIQVAEAEQIVRQRAGDNLEIALTAVEAGLAATSGLGLVVLLAAFMLADALALKEKTAVLERMTENAVDRLKCLSGDVRSYLKITGIAGLVVATGCTLLFVALGVDFALLWGMLLAVLSFVPYLGFWAALVPPVVLVSLERGLPFGLLLAAACVVVHSATGNILKPRLLSGELNLSPFTVVFSVVFWAFVFGPLGALLAIPATLSLKRLLLEDDPSLGWLAQLMSRRSSVGKAAPAHKNGGVRASS
ncbi:MAG TPA: AI-2E family transporter [Coriobacteriia bacterium]|nr:AI-2E family transporter [Coriobacteriia bacterium]